MERTNKVNAWHPKQLVVTDDFVLDQISTSSFLVVNKQLLRELGPNNAILLSHLIDRYKYFRDREKLKDDKWFFHTRTNQMEETGLTEYHWNASRKELEDKDLIKTKRMGVPAKLYYRINTNQICDLLKTRFAKVSRLDLRGSQNYNSINTINKETKEKETKKDISKKEKLFQVEQSSYSIDSKKPFQNNQPIDFPSFVDFFNESTGAGVRLTANKKTDIKKMLKHFTGQQIKIALENRAIVLKDNEYLTSWESIFSRKVERMEKYLNAETGSKKSTKTAYREKGKKYKTDMTI